MENINLTILEQEALLQFLKDYVNKNNLSIYNYYDTIQYLFLAFVKLQSSVDNWNKALKYSE